MEWQDWYTPRDYYGSAQLYARDFLKKHPEADSRTAYFAAQEAAELYERSTRLRKMKFKGVVHWKIVNDLYMKGRERMDIELREAIIAEYQDGKTPKEIAEQFSLNESTVRSNIHNWKKKGLFSAENEEGETDSEISFSKIEKIKPLISFVDAASIFTDCFSEWLGEEIELVECRASNRDNSATLILEDINGQSYALQFKKLED